MARTRGEKWWGKYPGHLFDLQKPKNTLNKKKSPEASREEKKLPFRRSVKIAVPGVHQDRLPRDGSIQHVSRWSKKKCSGACRPCAHKTHRGCSEPTKGRSALCQEDTPSAPRHGWSFLAGTAPRRARKNATGKALIAHMSHWSSFAAHPTGLDGSPPPLERPARPEPFRVLPDAQHLPLRAPYAG